MVTDVSIHGVMKINHFLGVIRVRENEMGKFDGDFQYKMSFYVRMRMRTGSPTLCFSKYLPFSFLAQL